MDFRRRILAARSMLSMFRMRSVLFRILIVLFVLVVGIVGIFYASFRRTFETRYTEQAIASDLALLEYAGSQVSRELYQIGTKSEDILQSAEVNREIVSGNVLHNPDSIRIALLLNRMAAEEPLAGRAVLCYREDNVFISSDNTVKTADWDDPFLQAIQLYEDRQGGADVVHELVAMDGRLFLMRSVPRSDPLATVTVEIDLAALYGFVEAQLKTGERLGEDGHLPVYAYYGRTELFSGFLSYPAESELYVSDREVRGQNNEVCTLSDSSGFLLAHTIPDSGLCLVGILRGAEMSIRGRDMVASMLPTMLVAVVLILLAGALLISIAYRPVGGLASDMMMQRSKDDRLKTPLEAENEFDLIRSLYQEQKDREQEMAETIQRAGNAVTDRILWDVIQEKESGEESVRAVLSQTRSAFRPNMKYQVVLIDAESDRDGKNDSAQEMLHRMMVQQFCRNYWKGKAPHSLPETGDELVTLILAFPKEREESALREEIRTFLRHLAEQAREYGFRPSAGIGTTGEDVGSLSQVYQTARSNLQKNLYYDRAADGEEVETEGTNDEYAGFYSALEQLAQEDSADVRHEIQTLVRSAKTETADAKERFLSIVDSAVELLSRFHLPCEEQCLALRRSIQEASPSAVEGYTNQVEAFLIDSVNKCAAAKNREKMHYLESAMHYIEEHYSDSMLSLASVGEKCGISGGYLSRLFAQYHHENFTDYLNSFRVERAGLLLSQTTMTIAEVGLHTGFNSPQNFSRVFKKYKNMTPSQYRLGERK